MHRWQMISVGLKLHGGVLLRCHVALPLVGANDASPTQLPRLCEEKEYVRRT